MITENGYGIGDHPHSRAIPILFIPIFTPSPYFSIPIFHPTTMWLICNALHKNGDDFIFVFNPIQSIFISGNEPIEQ